MEEKHFNNNFSCLFWYTFRIKHEVEAYNCKATKKDGTDRAAKHFDLKSLFPAFDVGLNSTGSDVRILKKIKMPWKMRWIPFPVVFAILSAASDLRKNVFRPFRFKK